MTPEWSPLSHIDEATIRIEPDTNRIVANGLGDQQDNVFILVNTKSPYLRDIKYYVDGLNKYPDKPFAVGPDAYVLQGQAAVREKRFSVWVVDSFGKGETK